MLGTVEPIAAVRFAAGILAPPRCSICAAPAAAGALICAGCDAALGTMRVGNAPLALGRTAIATVTWAAAYDGVARELVTTLKFRGRVGLAEIAASAIADAIGPTNDLRVVPVPAAPLRLRRRGFDPGELIATRLASRLGLELAPCLARRSGRRQVGRHRAERLARAPHVRATTQAPARVLLVDDVLTTGATLGACADTLRRAGSTEIEAAVFARSLGPARTGA